jgi:3-hydroxyisobutyrate dehydrogenase
MGTTAAQVGWIGTGRMGAAMCRRLLERGQAVAVYNRTRAKAEALADQGAKVVERPADLAGCGVVFVTVAGDGDLEAVVSGPGGLLAEEGAPRLVVDCSTVSGEESERVRKALAKRGSTLLVAPVSGNPKVARAGRLTMAVSGPTWAYEEARPLLDAIGSGSTWVGEGEEARLVKLCHNLFLGVVSQALAEVTVLAERAGVRRADFLGYLNRSVMGSVFSGYKTPQLVHLDFEATFTSTLLRKDFDLGLGAARALEVPMPVAALVHQLVQRLVGEGFADQDFAALLVLQARAAGMTLTPEDREVEDGLGGVVAPPARRDQQASDEA